MLLTVALLTSQVRAAWPEPITAPGVVLTAEVPVDESGTRLYTRVYLPEGVGPWPVVLMRAPYPMGPVLRPRCRLLNRHGYACVHQDARGQGRSEGEWLPFENEGPDGRATVEWIAARPWSDGRVAMMGESYLGAASWVVAHDPPEALKTIVPIVIGTDMYGALYEGGLFRHDVATGWMSLMPGAHRFRIGAGPRRFRRALTHRPRRELDEVSAGVTLPWFDAWIDASRPEDPFWTRPIVQVARQTPATTPLPVLSVAGWSDAFLGSQMTTWERMGNPGNSLLVVGPWNHLSMVPAQVRQTGIEDEANGLTERYVPWPLVLDWLGHHLRGEPLDSRVGGVWTYRVNGGGWSFHDSWPPASTARAWGLADAGSPGTCHGVLAEAGGSGSTRFRYDPVDPTPSRGGAGVLVGNLPMWRGAPAGFVDQGSLCDRSDVVGFMSEPFAEPVRVVGRLAATVWFSSTASDTAVNVRFLEERADGGRIHVRETIRALSHRDGRGHAAYTPGDVVAVDLETWPVDYVFEPGSRLLVQFASSSFPKYEAHANVAGPWGAATETPAAEQTVHHARTVVRVPVVSDGAPPWRPRSGR